MRKALVLFSFVSVLFVNKLSAQAEGSDYQTAVGIKFWPGAITVKHFVQDNAAVEGLFNFWNGFRVTGLYEIHGDISAAPGLKWYVGPGAHIGWYNENWSRDGYYYGNGGGSFGVDGILGLDYKFNGAPIDLSVDIQPYFELINHPYFDVWGGLSIRYAF